MTDELWTCVNDAYDVWAADKQDPDYDWSQVDWYELDSGFLEECKSQ